MDLADQIDDYICTFDGVGDLTMDTLAMVLFAWAVMALFLAWLCKLLYNKYVAKKGALTTPGTTAIDAKSGGAIKTSVLGSSATTDDLQRRSEPKDLFTKDRESSVKPLGAAGARAGRPGPGIIGVGGQNPAVRKRLSRKSPGPELRRTRVVQPPSNVVGPETVSVTWTSQVFRWLYSDLVIVNELLGTWVQALNDYNKKSLEEIFNSGPSSNNNNPNNANLNNNEQHGGGGEHGVAVEIVRVLPESPPPQLSNIFCSVAENAPNDVTVTMDCECMPVLQLKAYRQKAGKIETSHYKAIISRFRGRLTIKIDYYKLKGDLRTEGYPEIKLALNSIGAIKGAGDDESQLQDVITEIIILAMRNTVYPIDFSIYSTCPRAVELDPPEVPENMEHLNPLQSHRSPSAHTTSNRRLLVKIIKGEGLAHAADPYCVVEMDEPPQKNQTGARQGKDPFWDEHFLFDLSPQSAELLFEVYDRSATAADGQAKFLGLGLVGIEELAVGPASSQILSLQPRPYESEKVSGAIMVEFVFIDGAEIPTGRRPYKLKNALKINTSTSALHEPQHNGAGDIVDTAIKAIEKGALNSNNGQPSKSTLIIHSVQRVGLNEKGLIEMDANDESVEERLEDFSEVTTPGTVEENVESQIIDSPLSNGNNSITTQATIEADDSLNLNDVTDIDKSMQPGDPMAQSSPHHTNGFNGTNGHSATPNTPNSDLDERGRPRNKKRDFFGTLKRKLGRSKSRTKSADREMIPIDANNPRVEPQIRSISADRNMYMNNGKSPSTGPHLLPQQQQRLIVPTLDQSRRSSLSESSAISGISSASAKTYIHEASTLVLETIENGVKKHFLVPMAIAQRPRWRKKGTKLHIYNDHTFVAKHLSGGLLCDVCNRSIPRRPGKQGYECRDCLTKCHKQCHVRAPQACTNPTVLSIELSKLNSAAADRSIRKL